MRGLLIVSASLAVFALGCEPVPKNLESNLLDRLGELPCLSVSKSGEFDPASLREAQKAVSEIRSRGQTIGETVKACREVKRGVPTELRLEAKLADVSAEIGPPQSQVSREYAPLQKEIKFFQYGNLVLGVDGETAVVLCVLK